MMARQLVELVLEEELPTSGTFAHRADGIIKIVDFGNWPEMKAKYPEACALGLAMHTDKDVDETKLGRTWILEMPEFESNVGHIPEKTLIAQGSGYIRMLSALGWR